MARLWLKTNPGIFAPSVVSELALLVSLRDCQSVFITVINPPLHF